MNTSATASPTSPPRCDGVASSGTTLNETNVILSRGRMPASRRIYVVIALKVRMLTNLAIEILRLRPSASAQDDNTQGFAGFPEIALSYVIPHPARNVAAPSRAL